MKTSLTFLLTTLLITNNNLKAQYCNGQPVSCLYGTPIISFKGTAPSPWAIDGSIKDWETLLGPSGNDPTWPFCPPQQVSSNWAVDWGIGGTTDLDTPDSASNLQFSAFTHDDYNVYFYFRRLKNGAAPNEFFYFCDVNADGYMNFGEPVFHATFSSKGISALSVSVYIPDIKKHYTPIKGNDMVQPSYLEQNFLRVDKFPLPGRLIELFNSSSIPKWAKLNNKEIFSAALTENGFGAELAVPWKYLKSYLTYHHQSFDPRNAIFTYKVELQPGTDKYDAGKVADNIGSCCNSFVTMGNVNLGKYISNITLKEGSSYRFKIAYTNPTNVTEIIGIEKINLDNLQYTANGKVYKSGVIGKVHPDFNCNGVIDAGEDSLTYVSDNALSDTILHHGGGVVLVPENYMESRNIKVPRFGTVCIIIDVFMPANSYLISGDFKFESSVEFNLIVSECHAGGKTINPVGTVKTQVGKTGIAGKFSESEINTNNLNNADVNVYPNPNNGAATISLPLSENNMEANIYDVYGRTIRKWHHVNSNIIKVSDLSSGVYFIKVMFQNGKTITRKMVVSK